MKTYSQNDEQAFILEHFKGEKGRFLDIGAFDGATFSNTRALAELGWGGVLVEPSPESFLALKRLYRDRPDVTLVNALIGYDWQLVVFHDSPDAVGTANQAHYEKWKGAGQYQDVMIPETPLAHLLYKLPGPYDFITIDTEGTSLQVLRNLVHLQNDLGYIPPKLLCVEVDDFEEMQLFCRQHGFTIVHRTSENVLLTQRH